MKTSLFRSAERQGFEPWVPVRARRISSAVHSTTLPSLLGSSPHIHFGIARTA